VLFLAGVVTLYLTAVFAIMCGIAHWGWFRPKNIHTSTITANTETQMQLAVYKQAANVGAVNARSLIAPSAKPIVLSSAHRLMYAGSHSRWLWLCSQAARRSIAPLARVMSKKSHWKKK
jgi:hypothetical protein